MNNTFNLLAIFNIFGNGDIQKGRNLLIDIASRIQHAHKEHAWGKNKEIPTPTLAMAALESEIIEWDHAIECESEQRQYDEALDIIAVAIRIANMEYKN